MLVLMCESCQIRVPAYDSWVEHVLSDHHQGNSLIKKIIVARNVRESFEKGLMVIVGDLSALTASKVAWHVSNFGLLCDLYYGPNNKYVIFHLDSRDCNEAAQSGTTQLEDTKVEVQWVANIPVIEWEKMFPLHRRPNSRVFVPNQISLPAIYFPLIETIFQQESISHEELTRRHLALTDVASIIQPQYPHATFHPYGSYITGLGSADSSLNFFVANIQTVAQGKNQGYHATVPSRNTIEEVAWYLSNLPPQSKSICTGITIISTPDSQRFIQFRHVPTNLLGNIYIRNPLPVQRSKLVAFYMTLDDRVRPFLQLVRYWGRFHGLTAVMPGVQKPTVMRNYALMLLALVFLENVQIIPSVQVLQLIQKDDREPCPVGPWDGSFCDDKEQVLSYMEMTKSSSTTPAQTVDNPNESLTNKVMSLAVEFFNRTALLEPNSLVVCSLLGKFRPKFQFFKNSLDQIPEGLERYKQAIQTGAFKAICAPPERNAKQVLSLVVQDPFELTVNVTEHLTSDFLIKFRQICCKTALSFQKLIVPPGKHRNDIGTLIKDLFSPVPMREINIVQMKLLIGELMCKRRDINKKNSQQPNGFATDNYEKDGGFHSNQSNKYDSFYEQPKPQPLMSLQPFSGNKAGKNYPPPLMPQMCQTSYPLPLLGTDYNRRDPSVSRPQPLMTANVNYKLPSLSSPPPPPTATPIIMANKDTTVRISNDSLYQSIFKQHFGNLESFVETGYLDSKMNALWLKCFTELILAVWHKCFKLENVLVKENNDSQFKKHNYSEAIFDFLDINSSANPEDEPLKKKRRDMLGNIEDGEVNDGTVENLMNKITQIPDIPTSYSSTFECLVCKPFFSGRQDIVKWMSDKTNKNPLEREEEITRKVLVRCNAADLTTNITIKCSVTADMSKDDDQIELWFNESFDKSKSPVEDEFLQRFFSLLVPEYAIFRLCQLLDIPNSWQIVDFNK